MQIKRADGYGALLCAHYEVDAKGGILMCNLKGRMDKDFEVEIKGWMQKVAL